MFRIKIISLVIIFNIIQLNTAEIDKTDLNLELSFNNSKLNEEQFNITSKMRRSGCSVSVTEDLKYPQPVYLKGSELLMPSGNSGTLRFDSGEEVLLVCTGPNNFIQGPTVIRFLPIGTIKCEGETMFTGNFIGGSASFGELSCTNHPETVAEETGQTCYGEGKIIRVGFVINNVFYLLYSSCFDKDFLSVQYVKYEQTSENVIIQNGPRNTRWRVGSFFGDLDVDRAYSRAEQNRTIAGIVGQELADKYITNTHYISRGHLAARADFIFATGQIASYYFINAAPQWQPFNGANWNQLELNLRRRIAELGARTTIYTGTFGISQLRNQNGDLVDIHLAVDINNNPQLPVPLYYYKVVHDEENKKGTAFIGINGPYYTREEALKLQFCPDQCRDNKDFTWIRWNPDNLSNGFSFCCTIEDFRLTVPHLPEIEVDGLFGGANFVVVSRWMSFITLLVLALR